MEFLLRGHDCEFLCVRTIRLWLFWWAEPWQISSSKTSWTTLKTTIVGQITSVLDLGCFVTAVLTSIIGNGWSGKSTVMIGCTIHIIGGIIQSSSYTVWHLSARRLIAGFDNGLITVAIPLWQSESTLAHIRGQLIGVLSFLDGLGGIFIAWVYYRMVFVDSSVSWRFPVAP